ncbi:MAG: S-methyl-5'-thioadenosine phosphorylase [Alphaproteobacteria bacterium]|nr:S-methyl-5'-thioadenosine phosphorylase [Alphaproteobacteria bacterium]
MTVSDGASPRVLGFVGGSGLYDLDGLEGADAKEIQTPWGRTSGPVVFARIGDVDVRFLARHGLGHTLTPGAVNYRANIDAMKRAGVTDLYSISACGSFREDLPPGAFVIVDQFIDRAAHRDNSFFGPGCVAHVSMADPVCPNLAAAAADACAALGISHEARGTYLSMDGPQFSSRAESNLYRSWGCDIIGMTNATEAKLAREAELPYASIAMVTDFDCWRETGEAVEVAAILDVMRDNVATAKRLIPLLAERLGAMRTPSPLGIETCLDFAIITPPAARDPVLLEKLDAIAGRALGRQA